MAGCGLIAHLAALCRGDTNAGRINHVRAAKRGAQVASGAGVRIDGISGRSKDKGGTPGNLLAAVAAHAGDAVDIHRLGSAVALQLDAGRAEGDGVDAGAREHVAQDIGAGQRVERIDGDHVIDAKVLDYMLAQPLAGLCAKEGAAGNHNSEDRDGALRGKPGEASGRIVRGNLGIQGEMDASLDGGLVYGAATGNLLLVAGQQGVFAAGAGGCRRVPWLPGYT